MVLNLKSNTPRWLIFAIDLLICLFSVLLAYLLRFNFNIPEYEIREIPGVLVFVLIVRAASFFVARTYAGIIRHTSTEDAMRIVAVIASGSVLFAITNVITFNYVNASHFIPYSIIIMDFITTIFAMTTFRLLVKMAYFEIHQSAGNLSNVVIYGAGEAGIIVKQSIERDTGARYRVSAYVDDDSGKAGKTLEGIKIMPSSKLETLLQPEKTSLLIFATYALDAERKSEVVDLCLKHEVRVLNVPPVRNWINGELSFNQIRTVKIEDLLERDVIRLDEEKIKSQLSGKTILVTGASGSIGSEIARQVMNFDPAKIILVDQAETDLFHLELEYLQLYDKKDYEIVIADICNDFRMKHIFNTWKPQIVFHAAAYKHVPMMENHPSEAVYTNITGTRLLADIAVKSGVDKFIMISSDKAVNPTNVMGASKRIAEIYCQSLNNINNSTRFITTRFGNVLGSNGSVIPLFRKQIEKGGPVTITHPEITRYFMTIPEACQLVLEAGAIGNGGEIFVFDMGKSVKIVEMAKKMIRLSGLTPGKDIQIKFTGLRPGEKLYEELLAVQENTLPTHHPRIMIAKVREYDFEHVKQVMGDLLEHFRQQDNTAIVRKMKEIVPEYKSHNSQYESLD